MTDNYNGNPANVTTPLVRSISGCTLHAGVIQVQTTAAHDFATNDTVSNTGIVGTVEANGRWVIDVIDATHFTLRGSTFTHAYVSGGTTEDLSLTPYFQIPSNGEYATTDSILSAIQNVADKVAFVYLKPGGYKIVDMVTYGDQSNPIISISGVGDSNDALLANIAVQTGDIVVTEFSGAVGINGLINGVLEMELDIGSYGAGVMVGSQTRYTLESAYGSAYQRPLSMTGSFTATGDSAIAISVHMLNQVADIDASLNYASAVTTVYRPAS